MIDFMNDNKITISFDSNGGSDCNPITVKKNGKYENLPTPGREGYLFNGWYTEETDDNGTGTQVNNGAAVEKNENHTLYASWQINYTSGVAKVSAGVMLGENNKEYIFPSGPTGINRLGCYQAMNRDQLSINSCIQWRGDYGQIIAMKDCKVDVTVNMACSAVDGGYLRWGAIYKNDVKNVELFNVTKSTNSGGDPYTYNLTKSYDLAEGEYLDIRIKGGYGSDPNTSARSRFEGTVTYTATMK